MYDWANSAFYTTVIAAIFPPFYRSLVKNAGYGEAEATAYWAYATSIALLLSALIGPVLGAISDRTGGKRIWITVFTGIGVVASAAMVLLGDDSFVWGAALFIVGSIGVTGAIVFYDSLLPYITRNGDIDRVSARGYALGYLGGGTLLVVNVLMITYPRFFLLSGQGAAIRASFVSVAVWWAVFTIPLLRHVPEPPATIPGHTDLRVVKESFLQIIQTLRQLRRHRQMALFLLAFLIYNDGIGTIIKMATAYGDELGIGLTDLVSALIVTQFVGIPCSFAFGWLAGKIGTKTSILLGLGVYGLISVAAFAMTTAVHFYILALMVGLVQGGTQALSRSLYGMMVPLRQSAEFFGFFSTSSKLAGTLGPVVFGLVSQAAGESRWGILSLILFFAAGAVLLSFVDVAKGKDAAVQANLEAETAGSKPAVD